MSAEGLPVGWQMARVADILDVQYGKALAKKDRRPGAVEVWTSSGSTGEHDHSLAAGPALVIGRKGAAGRVHLVGGEFWATDTAFYAVVPSGYSPEYLFYALTSAHLERLDQSTALPSLSRDHLRQTWLPVPPLDEQRAIVVAIEDAFARIDAIEAELDAVERLAGSLERSLLRDSLTGAILGNQGLSSDTGLPPGWQYAAIDEIADVSLGRQKSPEHATGEHMVSYIRAANLTWDGLDLADVKEMNFSPAEQSKYSLREGDVLVCEASGSATEVGKAVVWHGELPLACFQNHVIRLRPKDEVTSDYLYLAITESARLGRFVRAVSGIGITNLGLKRMREWKIAFPPIEQQSEVVDAWERSTAQRVALLAAVAEGRALIGQLRARTLHSAFTGNRDHLQRSEKARVV